MTMISRFWCVFGLVAALGAAVAACSSSSSPAAAPSSGEGESCTKTGDCRSGLACVENTCVPKVIAVGDGGRDATVTGEASVPSGLGQSCINSPECGPGLTCVAVGGLGGGLCDYTSFGLTPTGKSCVGQCETAADCCELPRSLSTYPYAVSPFGYVLAGQPDGGLVEQVHTCGDILALVIGGDATICNTALNPTTEVGIGCFYYQTYCAQCTSHQWACTANQCVYTGTCTPGAAAPALGGCPSQNRVVALAATTCHGDADGGAGSGVCQAATCQANTDCVGRVADNGNTCVGADCVCYQNACYFPCGSNLDCPGGYACNTTSMVCQSVGACTSDLECTATLDNSRGKCHTGDGGTSSCVVTCSNDHDCSPSSGATPELQNQLGPFNGQVCSNGYCQSVRGECTTNADCTTSGGVSMFCVAPSSSSSTVSAVTN